MPIGVTGVTIEPHEHQDAIDALNAALAEYGGLTHDDSKHVTFTSAVQGYLEAPEELREGYRAVLGSLYAFSEIDLENLDSVIEGVADDIASEEIYGPSEDLAAQVAHNLEEEQRRNWAAQDEMAGEDRTEDEWLEDQALQSETWEALKRQSAARKALEEGGGERKPHPSEGWQLSVPTGDTEAMYYEKLMGWLGRTAEGMRERRAELKAEVDARGEAYDRELGPIPTDLLRYVSDEPATREKGKATKRDPRLTSAPEFGGPFDEVPFQLEDGSKVTLRLKPGYTADQRDFPKEAPSKRAARIAMSKKEEEKDTD